MKPKVMFDSSKNSNVFHKVRFNVPDPFFLVDFGSRALAFLDRRDIGGFREESNPEVESLPLESLIEKSKEIQDDTETVNKIALIIFKEQGFLGKEVLVPRSFPLDMADFLRSKGAIITPVPLLYPERSVKSEEEKLMIKKSITATRKAFLRIEHILSQSLIDGEKIFYKDNLVTSEYLKTEAERVLVEEGMMSMEGIIISCGPHSAQPHHQGRGIIRPHSSIICDIFPRNKETGYFGDMTRTYLKGVASKEILKMYESVLKAQEVALEIVKAGVKIKDIHEAVCEIFKSHGHEIGDRGFVHGTGHGLGLDIHESPLVFARSEGFLEKGNIITLEPGLYYPEHGGIRIEDVVYITNDGCENLTGHEKKLVID